MMRRFGTVAVVTTALVAFGPALDACGDKSLSVGGIRMQRAMAARYPASIIAYAPSTSRLPAAARDLKLPDTVRLVGHQYHEVATLRELRSSIDTGRFNIVIADVVDVPDLERDLQSSASRAVLVPVAYKATKEEGRELAKQRRFLIKAPGRAADYLTTIAEAVRSRSAIQPKG